MSFTPAETAACRRLVELALEEDFGCAGDLTSRAVIPPKLNGRAAFIARASGVVAGLPAVDLMFSTANTPLLKFQPLMEDGSKVQIGDPLGTVTGLMEFILSVERTALNFLQHLSGIATLTRRYVDAIAGLPCQICDTRKTTPGWRLLEKYAVRSGGGQNHRMGLHDGILIKDNHFAALGGGREAFQRAARALHEQSPVQLFPVHERAVPLEIEVDSLDQLSWAVGFLPNIILLDNMIPDRLREAVLWRNDKAPNVLLEASGGVTLETVRAIAETGVDRISVGALTHSASALDIALDYLQ